MKNAYLLAAELGPIGEREWGVCGWLEGLRPEYMNGIGGEPEGSGLEVLGRKYREPGCGDIGALDRGTAARSKILHESGIKRAGSVPYPPLKNAVDAYGRREPSKVRSRMGAESHQQLQHICTS